MGLLGLRCTVEAVGIEGETVVAHVRMPDTDRLAVVIPAHCLADFVEAATVVLKTQNARLGDDLRRVRAQVEGA